MATLQGAALAKAKARLRAQTLAAREAMTPQELQGSDDAITAALLALPQWRDAQTLFVYVSVKGEPDTHAAIQAALAAGKRVCVPLCHGAGRMTARQITGLDALRPAAFGLLEPAEDAPLVPPEALELVVAPCVAADEAGHRLGYGGGYYDHYLAAVCCPVVCLCRRAFLQAQLPTGPHDRPVDRVVFG